MSIAQRVIDRVVSLGVTRALGEAQKPGGLIERRITQGVEDVLREAAVKNRKTTHQLRPAGFVWEMAFEFIRTDHAMPVLNARDLALETLRSFLRDEKIRFGDRAYDWSQSGAVTLAREWEIEHWEAT